MATTTSNFGWPIPQSTDLVKDGATAIASLGSGVDTSMAELKGGTTGQILSKTSNTDMDFTWITPNPGDITGVTAGTGITGGGTSGDVTVSFDIANYGGGQYAAGKNKIINGDFGIWQRGTTATVTADQTYYAPDRFLSTYAAGGATVTWSQQSFTAGTAPVSGYEGQYFSRIAATSGSGTTVIGINQRIEDVRTLANQTGTFSFWAKGDSARTMTILIVQKFGSGGSGDVTALNTSTALSTSWTRYSFNVSVPSVSGKTIGAGSNLAIYVYYNTGQASGSPQLDTWGWQLEAGSTATPFQTATGTKQGELAACQRYYQVFNRDNMVTTGAAITTAAACTGLQFLAEMRTAPTITLAGAGSGSGQISFLKSNGDIPATIGSIAAQNITKYGFRIDATGFTSAFTAGNASLLWANSADVWKASAEL